MRETAVAWTSWPASITAAAEGRGIASADPTASDPLTHLTHYVLVRADLPRGLQAAMIVHAAGESSPGDLGPDTFAVVLSCRDELHLALEADRLAAAGVPLVRVHEPDAPYHGALMALGL